MYPENILCGFKKMIYDEACLHIKNVAKASVAINYQSLDCHECSLQPFIKIADGDVRIEIMKTTFGTVLQFPFNNSDYRHTLYFQQHGHYGINITESGISELFQISPPNNENAPLHLLLWILMVGWMLWTMGCYIFSYTRLYSRLFQPRLIVNEAENDLGGLSIRSGNSTPLIQDIAQSTFSFMERDDSTRRRIHSLDVFRGITITLMLFVNFGGGNYWIFQHSSWNGLTIADVVFPWFVWIMGTSLMLSMSCQFRRAIPRRKIFSKVIFRSLALCVIGISLNSVRNNNITTLRFPGVLQRLGLSYLIVGTLETAFITAQNRYNINGRMKKVEDWIYSWAQWIIMLTLVGLYCLVTFCIKVPGCPNGYLGPGGLHKNSSFPNCTGGIAGYLDRQIFLKHMYNGTLVSAVYHNKLPFDPEGLLGTLTTAFTVFLGVHAGRITLCYLNPKGRIIRWLVMAVILGGISGFLSGWTKDEGIMPLNKNLWSISFALVTSSLAFFMKSVLFFFVDFKEWWSGSPFRQVGKNALFIYIGSIITAEAIPWNWQPIDLTTHSDILWMNVWSTCLWIIVAIFLDLWNIYVTL